MHLARFDHKAGVVDGVVFRSTLEARWAKFFSLVGLDWTYEPETFTSGAERYTPDFFVEGLGYVEIKPEIRFLKESGKRLMACLDKMRGKSLYVFACPDVAFRGAVLALFKDGKIYALDEPHILSAICDARNIKNSEIRNYMLDAIAAAIQHSNVCRIEHDATSAQVGKPKQPTSQLEAKQIGLA